MIPSELVYLGHIATIIVLICSTVIALTLLSLVIGTILLIRYLGTFSARVFSVQKNMQRVLPIFKQTNVKAEETSILTRTLHNLRERNRQLEQNASHISQDMRKVAIEIYAQQRKYKTIMLRLLQKKTEDENTIS